MYGKKNMFELFVDMNELVRTAVFAVTDIIELVMEAIKVLIES